MMCYHIITEGAAIMNPTLLDVFIDLALQTRDKEWFMELVELKKYQEGIRKEREEVAKIQRRCS